MLRIARFVIVLFLLVSLFFSFLDGLVNVVSEFKELLHILFILFFGRYVIYGFIPLSVFLGGGLQLLFRDIHLQFANLELTKHRIV